VIDKQLAILSQEIVDKQKTIAILYDNLAQLKENYAKMINFAYRNRNSYSLLMYVLAADNLNQAYRRMSYLKTYSDHRIKQAKDITLRGEEISRELAALRVKKAEQEYFLSQKTVELIALDVEEKQYQSALTNLHTREQELKRNLEAKKVQAAKLNKQIEDAIAEEARQEEVRRREAEKRDKAEAVKMAETEIANSIGFERLRGRLPMPVKGVIVTRFGIHDHLEYKGIKDICNGIEIATTDGMVAKVVADGVVRKIFISGGVTCVMVQHGIYYTLYIHLKMVIVQMGDKVRAGQPLGMVTPAPNGRVVLEFQLWRQTVAQNPEPWLAR